MIQLIVVPLDGTPLAEHAIPVAGALAGATGARIVLARVVSPAVGALDLHDVTANGAGALGALEAAARVYLDGVRARIGGAGGAARVPVDVVISSDSAPHDALHRLAAARGADLVVMASHDRGALARALFGSVSERLARAPGVPVLIVPGTDVRPPAGWPGPDPATDSVPYRHVLVPLDGSEHAEAVLPAALAVAHACRAAITLLAVRDPTPTAPGARAPSETAAYLDPCATRLRAEGLTVEVRVTSDPDRVRAIVRTSAEIGADLIAMTTHGRGTLARLIHGSVALEVLHAVPGAVLLLHPATPPQRRGEPDDASGAATGMG